MPREEAFEILREAVDQGVRFFDTAAAYGESEERIGDFGLNKISQVSEISTKIPAVTEDLWASSSGYSRFLHECIARSLSKLKLNKLQLLQFHQCDERFLSAPHVHGLMRELIDSGLCSSIGVSVYTPVQAEAALAIPFVQALQVPLSILDQRFIAPNLLELYSKRGIRLIARSILLQGLLVDHAELPDVPRKKLLCELKRMLEAAANSIDIPLSQAALSFVFRNCAKIVDIGLLGVDSKRSLTENLATLRASSFELSDDCLGRFSPGREFAQQYNLENPGNWSQT